MKQKRKEMGLFSSKMGLNVLWVVVLLGVLWGILCLASVWLLGKSAIAADNAPQNKLNYDWLEDRDEVVYEVLFIETDENKQLTEDDFSNVYKKGKSLYITPKNVVVTLDLDENPEMAVYVNRINKQNGEYVYGHVLWWISNTLSSNNVTLIGWIGNTVGANTSNSAVLWWKRNSVDNGSKDNSVVLVGWEWNTITNNNKWDVIIWWKSNTIWSSASDVAILWWVWSTVEWSNTIVWWSSVTVTGNVENVFAFSNKGLQITSQDDWSWPESKAFYLDVANGAWINVKPGTEWIDVGWAVGIGVIDMDSDDAECNQDSYGLQWTYEWCLMWCTKNGWELLDGSDECQLTCEELKQIRENLGINDTICTKDCSDPEFAQQHPDFCPDPAPWECVWGLETDPVRMHPCTDKGREKYLGILFEKDFIDSGDTCPSPDGKDSRFGDNKCIYQCNSDYHRKENIVDMQPKYKPGVRWCFKNCSRNGKTIEHGAISTWYSKDKESCAYGDDDDKDPKSVYTCGLYEAPLMCVDGTLYTIKKDEWGKDIPDKEDTEHQFANCTLDSYTCDKSKYTLSTSEITSSPFSDSLTQPGDRQSYEWARWTYTLCIDYDAIPNKECKEKDKNYNVICNNKTTPVNIGWGKYKCAYTCTDRNGNPVPHWTKDVAYKAAQVNCEWPIPNPNNSCETVNVQCEDGKWLELDGAWNLTSKENSIWNCETITSPRCEGFWFPSRKYNALIMFHDSSQQEFYESCGFNNSNGKWCEGAIKYKFSCAKDGYTHNTVDFQDTGLVDVCEKIPTCGKPKSGKECNDWDLVDGSFEEKVVNWLTWHQWQCKWAYGTIVPCEKFFECSNTAPSWDGIILTQKYPTTDEEAKKWSYSSSSQANLKACEFTCGEWYHINGDKTGCDPNKCKWEKPAGTTANSDKKPASHNSVSWTCDATSTDACTYSCQGTDVCNSNKNGCESENKCQWSYPSGATPSTVKPSNNTTSWKCSTSLTNACTYTCPKNQKCSNTGCVDIPPDEEDCAGNDPDKNGWAIKWPSTYKFTGSEKVWGIPNPVPSNLDDLKACEYVCKECYYNHGWICVGNSYEITYDCNGWSGNPWKSGVNYYDGWLILKGDVCSKSNKTFVWWAASATANGPTWLTWTVYTWCTTITLYAVYNDNTCGGKMPEWSAYKTWSSTYAAWHTPTSWTYTSSSKPGACQYTCDTDVASWNGSTCVEGSKSCGGKMPEWSAYKTWSSTYAAWHTPTSWTYTWSSTPWACEYTCDTNVASWKDGVCKRDENIWCSQLEAYKCDDWSAGTGIWYDVSSLTYTWKCGNNNCSLSKWCNNCAKNGLPYCFPIDFSSSCNEGSDSYINLSNSAITINASAWTFLKEYWKNKDTNALTKDNWNGVMSKLDSKVVSLGMN